MKTNINIKATIDNQPVEITIDATYTLKEALGLLKVYPKLISKVLKLVKTGQL